MQYYFGCHQRVGHGWYDTEMQRVRTTPFGSSPVGVPWKYVDGKLKPSYTVGEAALHFKDGWVALAFEDNSVDKRPGSNSVFVFPGRPDRTFEEIVGAARALFPRVWERFTFEVVQHGG